MAWLRVGDPRGRTRTEALHGDRAVVGRSAACEIQIDDPDVALRHVSILKTDHGLLIVNETESLPIRQGTQEVNNHFMEMGVQYRIGSSTITLVEDDEAPAGLGSLPTLMATQPEPPSATPTLAGGTDVAGPPPTTEIALDPPAFEAAPRTHIPDGPPPWAAPQAGATQIASGSPPAMIPPDEARVPRSRFVPPPPPAGAGPADSWIWRRNDQSQAGSGPSVYSMGDGTPVVHASTQSWGWYDGNAPPAELEHQIDLPPDPATPRPPAPQTATPPRPTPPRPTPPRPTPPRPPVQPVVLPLPERKDPPLPPVSKQLTSGHSWLWALPSSLRSEHAPGSMLGGRGPSMLVVGLLLVCIGVGLIVAAFLVGLRPDLLLETLRGGA